MLTHYFKFMFSSIYFKQFSFNIDCDKIIEELDKIENGFSSIFQKILILRVVQQFFCEMLIGGRKTVFTNSFF